MDFWDFFDLRMLVVIITASWWMPFAKVLWRAVNPYPHLNADKAERREGPLIELPLVSEEWAEVRKLRDAKAPAEAPAKGPRPLARGFRPVLRRLDGAGASERTALKRRA